MIGDHEMGSREWWLEVQPSDHWYHPVPPFVVGVTQDDGCVGGDGHVTDLLPALNTLIHLVQLIGDNGVFVADVFGNLVAYGRRRPTATDWVMINDVELILPEIVADPLLLATIQISSEGHLADVHAQDEARSCHPHRGNQQ